MEIHGEEVARFSLARAPLPALDVSFFGDLETKGLVDFQGWRGITSVAQWNLP